MRVCFPRRRFNVPPIAKRLNDYFFLSPGDPPRTKIGRSGGWVNRMGEGVIALSPCLSALWSSIPPGRIPSPHNGQVNGFGGKGFLARAANLSASVGSLLDFLALTLGWGFGCTVSFFGCLVAAGNGLVTPNNRSRSSTKASNSALFFSAAGLMIPALMYSSLSDIQ
ncbi:hypothetical protein CH06BL_26540 [Chromobacterium haemolyticum]|nr:hypothetical protein CH06BL_26540 [Chromobacterium haemolyticum]